MAATKQTDGTALAPGKPRRIRQGAKGERTRQRIKEAFAELLGSKSFTAVTIADICRTSGITVGGFYFHFASQEALLDEVMAEYLDGLVGDFERALDDADGGELAGAVCGAFLTAYSERGGLARTFQQLIRLKSDYAVRWRLASQGAMARLATRLRRVRPGLAGEQALFLAYALVTMIVSKLDLVYVYRGRSGAQAAASRAALAGELGELWTRMAAGPGQA